MSDRLYLVDGHTLTAMEPSAPPDEDKLQTLIARYSELIGDDEDLLLVRREQTVSDSEDSSGRWSVDHLFVTRDAVPVLVEVKRAVDTRLRREVVGQLLDYAANGSVYWTAADAAQSFTAKCLAEGTSPEEVLSDFLGSEENTLKFWENLENNLRDGRLRMLIVADRIPRELARIVEFLNEQMRAEVHAIELRYFESTDGRLTLAPRTIGQTEKTIARKVSAERREPISTDEWIEREITPHGNEVVTGVRKWIEILNRIGAETKVASTKGSIAAYVKDYEGNRRYPLHMERSGRGTISFNWVYTCPGVATEATRHKFLDRFTQAIGRLTTKNLQGYPAFPAKRLNDEAKAKAFEKIAREWIEAVCRPKDEH